MGTNSSVSPAAPAAITLASAAWSSSWSPGWRIGRSARATPTTAAFITTARFCGSRAIRSCRGSGTSHLPWRLAMRASSSRLCSTAAPGASGASIFPMDCSWRPSSSRWSSPPADSSTAAAGAILPWPSSTCSWYRCWCCSPSARRSPVPRPTCQPRCWSSCCVQRSSSSCDSETARAAPTRPCSSSSSCWPPRRGVRSSARQSWAAA